ENTGPAKEKPFAAGTSKEDAWKALGADDSGGGDRAPAPFHQWTKMVIEEGMLPQASREQLIALLDEPEGRLPSAVRHALKEQVDVPGAILDPAGLAERYPGVPFARAVQLELLRVTAGEEDYSRLAAADKGNITEDVYRRGFLASYESDSLG